MSKEEKYIEIKTPYIIIAALCILYLIIGIISKNGDVGDMIIITSGEWFYYATFPLFSIFMGSFIFLKTKKLMLPLVFWFIYGGISEVIITQNAGFLFVCIAAFLISAFVTKLILASKNKR